MKRWDGVSIDRDAVVSVLARHAISRVASELKRCRKDRGLTIIDVARLSGISRNSLSSLESADANPTVEMLVRYASAMGKRVNITID